MQHYLVVKQKKTGMIKALCSKDRQIPTITEKEPAVADFA